MLSHVDLFSGIGGFSLAADWAGFKTVAFCEKNEWCQSVLKKHWSEVPLYEDIRHFPGRDYRGATLLTGGFPCQPFSQCGKRRGKTDDRYLWPELRQVITDVHPSWIVCENVPNIISMALPTVVADLEKEGYEVAVFLLPAHGVGAPHRRRRAFVVAKSLDTNSHSLGSYREEMHQHGESHSFELRHQQVSVSGQVVPQQVWETIDPGVLRMANGVSCGMDEDRKKRLIGLGNAIVPQLAYEVLKTIAKVELACYNTTHLEN